MYNLIKHDVSSGIGKSVNVKSQVENVPILKTVGAIVSPLSEMRAGIIPLASNASESL